MHGPAGRATALGHPQTKTCLRGPRFGRPLRGGYTLSWLVDLLGPPLVGIKIIAVPMGKLILKGTARQASGLPSSQLCSQLTLR